MEDVWFSLQLYEKKINAELLFTDTDSLTYEIKSENQSFSNGKIGLTLVII